MDFQPYYATAFLLAYLLVIFAMELLHRKWKVKAEYTRKIAHTLATISSLMFLLAFTSYWYVLGLGIIFFLIFYFGRKYDLLRSLESVGRRTAGTYILPIAVFLVFLIAQQMDDPLYFALPVLIVGISDPLAGYVGNAWKDRTQNIVLLGRTFNKTRLGSLAFFISAWAISLGVFNSFLYGGDHMFFLALGTASLATLVEMVSEGGIDNITVPLAITGLLFLLG